MRRIAAPVLLGLVAVAPAQERDVVRVGIVGLDTSHVVAFTKLMNDPGAAGDLARVRVVAAWPGGTDVASSWDRVEGFTREVEALGVEIVGSIPALVKKVDAILLESVDGRCHRSQVGALIDAFRAQRRKLPLFIDKPLAASLADAVGIAGELQDAGVPWFSSSSLRFGAALPDAGDVIGCEAWAPCSYEPTHPDLFWYGVHGVETLFAVMGAGCESVTRTRTQTADIVVGRWKDGRTGTFRGIRHGKTGHGATVFGRKGIAPRGKYRGYGSLVAEIAKFFRTKRTPVAAAETIEMFAFMAAAHESTRRGGGPVALAEMLGRERTRRDRSRPPNILFCIADDWSWPHAGAYGDKVVKTPNFDRIAREGVLFTNAYCAAPSCTASRGGILTGQAIHRLREGANLHSFLPSDIDVYPDLLEQDGYVVGHTRKGWGPGRFQEGGRSRNPAGPRFNSFDAFLKTVPEDKPFCFWFGSHDPHRGYEKGSGTASGMKLDDAQVPPFLPDTPEVRSDILDYYYEVQRFDTQVGELLAVLDKTGRLDDTFVVMTSDNGMPFPRAKANVYDAGARMPLAIMWRKRLRGGHVSPAFVHATDFAPTFLALAGHRCDPDMTGRSLLPLLFEGDVTGRREVYLERERHAHVRQGNLGYPMRAIRTSRFLYIRNLRSDRWPAGDPERVFSVGPFGDADGSPAKRVMLADRDSRLFELAFGKRPAEELYDLAKDPWQVANVAGDQRYGEQRARLRRRLDAWMKTTEDPRAIGGDGDRFDRYPYYGRAARRRR